MTDRFPYPLTNGQNLRIYNFVKNLHRRNKFYLVTYGKGDYPVEVKELFQKIYLLDTKPRQSRNGSWLMRFRSRFLADGLVVYDHRMASLLGEVMRHHEFDCVWISGWDMMVYCGILKPLPILADVVDDGVLELLREFRHLSGIRQLMHLSKRLIQVCHFERKYFKLGSVVNVVSEKDAKIIANITNSRHISVIHNGVDTNYFRPYNVKQDEFSLVFEGKIGFRPNVDAVLYFARNVLPLIREVVPDVRFHIVGKDPPPEVRSLASNQIVVTGFVQDIRPYLARAAVFVCPIRKGAGIKNKVLQAWAMGKAVVATPQSIGGLEARHGENILIARKSKEFAEHVVSLLQDKNKREYLGRNARKTVRDSYTWQKKAKELESVFQYLGMLNKAKIRGHA